MPACWVRMAAHPACCWWAAPARCTRALRADGNHACAGGWGWRAWATRAAAHGSAGRRCAMRSAPSMAATPQGRWPKPMAGPSAAMRSRCSPGVPVPTTRVRHWRSMVLPDDQDPRAGPAAAGRRRTGLAGAGAGSLIQQLPLAVAGGVALSVWWRVGPKALLALRRPHRCGSGALMMIRLGRACSTRAPWTNSLTRLPLRIQARCRVIVAATTGADALSRAITDGLYQRPTRRCHSERVLADTLGVSRDRQQRHRRLVRQGLIVRKRGSNLAP